MWRASLENGTIFLNGKEVECLKSFNIASSAEDVGIAELTMRMDVIINQTLIGSVEKEVERMDDLPWDDNLSKAHKWSKQAKVISICALLISVTSLFIRIFGLLQ